MRKVQFKKHFNRFSSNFISNQISQICKRNFTTALPATSLKITLPNLQSKEFQISDNLTLKDLTEDLKKVHNYEDIEYRTWDNSILAKTSNLNEILSKNDPFFIRINKMEWQILNPEIVFTQNSDCNLHLQPFSENQFSYILEKIKDLDSKHNLSEEELNQITFQILKLKNFYSNIDTSSNLAGFKNLTELFSEYYKLKSEYVNLHTLKEKLLRTCEIKSKFLIFLGGILFVIELFLLYYGTFVKYSWDIVEPITYLVGCCNIILILFYKKRIGNLSAFEYFTHRSFEKFVKKGKFNQKHLEDLGKKIKDLEKLLN
jgi:hypothetical protein